MHFVPIRLKVKPTHVVPKTLKGSTMHFVPIRLKDNPTHIVPKRLKGNPMHFVPIRLKDIPVISASKAQRQHLAIRTNKARKDDCILHISKKSRT